MIKIKKNISAGIVTFNPNITQLIKNVELILPQVDYLIIVDNNSLNIDLIEKINDKKIILIKNRENFGIAKALNQIFEESKIKEMDWVLTLDQDTSVPTNLISIYSDFLQNNEIGIICPNIFDVNIKNNDKYLCTEDVYVNECITSASLTRVSTWEKAGKFDEYLFIDEVDFDFCFRVRKNNLKIIKLFNAIVEHAVGEITQRKFLWKTKNIKNHSAFRKYYISRNIIYVAYKNNIKYKWIKSRKRFMRQVVSVILYENNKIEKIKAMIKGYRDANKKLKNEKIQL